jgi:hypothetical protein
MSRPGDLQRVAQSIADGQIRGEAAFAAIVDIIASDEIPPGTPPEAADRIRRDIEFGVRHDAALCELVYAPPQRPEVRPPAAPAPIPDTAPRQRPARAGRPKLAQPVAPQPVPDTEPRQRPRKATRPRPAEALAQGQIEPRRRERPHRRPRPEDESIDELDPAEFPADVTLPPGHQRQQVITGAIVVGGLLLVAALYYGLRSSPCDDLAANVCATMGEGCDQSAVRARFEEEKLNGTTCSTAFDAVRDLGADPAAYREKLSNTLGFDPLQASDAPAGEAEAPPAEAPKAVPIVQGQKTMSSLFVDPSHIYWTVTQPPAVYRIRSIGGEPELLSQTPMPGQLGVSENFAYWVSATTPPKIWADKIRGEHEPVAVELIEGFTPTKVAFMGPEAAFIDGQTGAVDIVAVANDTPTQLAAPAEPKPVAIVGNGQTVVWSTPGPGANIIAAPREGGAPRILAQGQSAAPLLAIDDTRVYWADPTDGSISSAILEGAEVATLVSGQPGISDLAVGADAVLWSNEKTGQILEVPKAGGESRVVATGLDAPRFVALDGAAVYWEAGGVVYRLPK